MATCLLPRRARAGFTLIELLVVIAIIAILASILFPVFAKAREKGRQVSCLSNQQQLALAVIMHQQENDEKCPSATTVWSDLGNPMLLKCLTKGRSTANAYVYNLFISGKTLAEIPQVTREIVTADGLDHEFSLNGQPAENILELPNNIDFRHSGSGEGFIASFCDGHAELLKEIPPMWIVDLASSAEFEREVARSNYPALVYVYTRNGSATEQEYCRRIDEIQLILDLAAANRLSVKFATVDGDAHPDLLAAWNLVPGDQLRGYPAFLFFRKGVEEDRMTGYPADTSGWIDDDWLAELSLCRQQIQQRLDAMK